MQKDMTSVELETYGKGFLLEVTGHTDRGPLGADIVCAAVSMLCYTLEAELRRLDCLKFAAFTSGGVILEGEAAGSEAERMFEALHTVMGGLNLLCSEYPCNVRGGTANRGAN